MKLHTNSMISHLNDLNHTPYSIAEHAKTTNQTFVDSVSAKVADITAILTEAHAANFGCHR